MALISVVVPTFDRLPRLQRVLGGLAAQTVERDRFEVVVVSDGSTDGTDEYLRSGATPVPVRAISQPNSGPAVARNRGVAHSTTDLVLFLDDDVVPDPRLIEEHLRSHEALGERAVVLGPMLTPDDADLAPWVRWEQVMLTKQYDAMQRGDWEPTARQFYTGNASIRRCHLDAVGGFDPAFRRAEDVELAYRLDALGLRFHFNPDAVGHHYAERSYSSWLDNAEAYGRNDVVMARQRGQGWLLRTIWAEFEHHHVLVRALVRAGAHRPRLRATATVGLRLLAGGAARTGWEAASLGALSGIYNLAHYGAVLASGGQPAVAR
jgi:GT2 family glycosyltransferase